MSDEQKETQENRGVPFDLSSCMAMMEEMMGQQEGGCDCAEMMSQMMGQGDRAAPSVMSQMMASCCGVQGETEETTSTDTTQEA
jgi:hypothetical protein